MILELAHSRLEVYKYSRQLVIECYSLTRALPSVERFNIIQQINRAAVSVILNLAEGSSRRSFAERKRFFEISRASTVEIDTAIQVCIDLNYVKETDLEKVKPVLTSSFRMLSKLIST